MGRIARSNELRALHNGFLFDSVLLMEEVTIDAEVLGGEPVFSGTRVPIRSFFDHLEGGESIEDFLEGFPSVSKIQVIAILEASKAHALAGV